jgi:glycosyltransferase involved in cell wall biosynthesis
MPWPLMDGGAIGIYRIVKAYADLGHSVTLLAVNTQKHYLDPSKLPNELTKICNVMAVPVNTNISYWDAFCSLFSNHSYHISRFINKDFSNKLIHLLENNNFDLIHIDGVFVSAYIDLIRNYTKSKIIYRAHNVEYLIWQRLGRENNWVKKIVYNYLANKLKKDEIKAWQSADIIAAITQEDKLLIDQHKVKTPVYILQSGVDIDDWPIQPLTLPIQYFHVGSMEWLPNINAVEWFAKQVLPEAINQFPNFKWHIAGRKLNPIDKKFDLKGIVNHGEVANLAYFLNDKAVAIIPLQAGGGMRIKIIEYMAMGKCIIASAIAAEGILYNDNLNILIANTPNEYLLKIKFCFENPDKVIAIGQEARKLIIEQYDNKNLVNNFFCSFIKITSA